VRSILAGVHGVYCAPRFVVRGFAAFRAPFRNRLTIFEAALLINGGAAQRELTKGVGKAELFRTEGSRAAGLWNKVGEEA
jgi:hypothetical protein